MAFLGRLYATLAVNTTQLNKAAADMYIWNKKANAAIDQVNAKLMASGRAMRSFGTAWSMYVTAPMAILGVASGKAFSEFEFSMTKIIGLVGVSREQVEGWQQAVIDMAPVVGKSTKELADALFFITSAGIRTNEAMEVLSMSAKASAAGLGETKVVARLVVSAMNAYGSSNLSAAEATDILVATVREANTEADELAKVMGYVLPIASYMGVTFDQVGAAVAGMTRTGTSAQTAVIQLRQMLNALIEPSQKSEKALRAMGHSSEELTQIIASGKGVREELNKLGTSADEMRETIMEKGLLGALLEMKRLTEEYGKRAAGEVFNNIRAFTGVVDLMGDNLEANKKIFIELADATGSADYAFEEASKTVKFKYNQAFGLINKSATRFGKTIAHELVPMILKVGQGIARLTDWYDGLNDSQKKLIVRIGLFVAAVGPLVTILGFLAGTVLPGLITLTRGVANAFLFMGRAIITNPVGALITAITTLVGLYAIWRRRVNQVAQAQMSLNKITDRAIESTVSQRVAVEKLFKIARDMTKTEKERGEAVKALNEVNKELFGFLNTENVLTIKATKARELYIAQLVREAKIKAVKAELDALELEHYTQVVKQGAKVLTFWQKLATAAAAGGLTIEERQRMIEDLENTNLENARKQIDDTRKELEKIFDELLTDADIKKALGLSDGVDDVKGDLISVAEVLSKFNEEVEFGKNMAKAFGGEFDLVTHMINTNQKAIEGYIKAGMDPLSEKIQQLVSDMRMYQLVFTNIDNLASTVEQMEKDVATSLTRMNEVQDDEMDKLMNSLDARGEYLSNQINDIILGWHGLLDESQGTIGTWTSMLRGAFNGMANVITNALNTTENKLDAFKKFFVDFITGLIIKLIAATVAALALAVVLTFIIPGKSAANLFSVLKEGFSFADAFKASFQSFGRLQHGGVVPPGYPNDTYPALLSSGETVLPAKPLPSMGPGEVVFRIDGYELVGILKKQQSLEQNY